MIGQLIAVYSTLLVIILFVVLAFPYFAFGLRLFFKKMTTKNNVGLLFIRNMADNFSLPHIVDLRKTEYKYKLSGTEYTYLIDRQHFMGFKFLNLPCVFFDANNIVTSIGVHSHALDNEGKPLYKEDGSPVVSLEKPSFSMHPALIKAILGSTALTEAMQKLFQNNKTQIYILAGIGIGIGISVYLLYNVQSVDLPAMSTQLNTIRAICEGNIANSTVVIQ